MKLQPPVFAGAPKVDEAETWIMSMEDIFEVMECLKDKKVTLATFRLQGEAKSWWNLVKRNYTMGVPFLAWRRFTELLYEKYFLKSIREGKKVEFIELKQGNMTVAEYEAKFIELARFAPDMTEIEREKNNEEYVKARDQRKRAFNAKKMGEGSSKRVGDNSNKKREISKGQAEKPDEDKPDKCQRCGGLHRDDQCRWNTGACFECGKKGHRVKDFPTKPAQPRLYQLINNCPSPNKKT
ncbi:hypothetical protein F0562_011354 [Nyssa sinensis]|uniref:Retrotransposon gag domain-containing protein n=1 Tax=Nyssa sinensis TaxID=561372 RepID=A0A5J5A4Z3_9ASTE|nr:hypothetical protein F0562_011354 [Nyssa sinensis]